MEALVCLRKKHSLCLRNCVNDEGTCHALVILNVIRLYSRHTIQFTINSISIYKQDKWLYFVLLSLSTVKLFLALTWKGLSLWPKCVTPNKAHCKFSLSICIRAHSSAISLYLCCPPSFTIYRWLRDPTLPRACVVQSHLQVVSMRRNDSHSPWSTYVHWVRTQEG